MDLIDKLSSLTTIPKLHLNKFKTSLLKIYSNDVYTKSMDNNIVELELFEGTLLITLEDDCVKYKFIPNEDFDKLIKDSLLHKEDKLVIAALDRLKSAFINTYKDIL